MSCSRCLAVNSGKRRRMDLNSRIFMDYVCMNNFTRNNSVQTIEEKLFLKIRKNVFMQLTKGKGCE